jgi:hypothetical protein
MTREVDSKKTIENLALRVSTIAAVLKMGRREKKRKEVVPSLALALA